MTNIKQHNLTVLSGDVSDSQSKVRYSHRAERQEEVLSIKNIEFSKGPSGNENLSTLSFYKGYDLFCLLKFGKSRQIAFNVMEYDLDGS